MPGPGQESVWDYPRPPRVEAVPERLRVIVDGAVLAETTRGFRVLETAGAPVYYFPPADVRMDRLVAGPHGSFCEWKGSAGYYIVRRSERGGSRTSPGRMRRPAAGTSGSPDYLAFYAGRVDEAWVGDERATPQPGGFYGGWVTCRIVGPIKGVPGSYGW